MSLDRGALWRTGNLSAGRRAWTYKSRDALALIDDSDYWRFGRGANPLKTGDTIAVTTPAGPLDLVVTRVVGDRALVGPPPAAAAVSSPQDGLPLPYRGLLSGPSAAAVNGSYALLSSGGSFTVALPADGQTGDLLEFFEAAPCLLAHPVTLHRAAGHKIDGLAEDLVLDQPRVPRLRFYAGTSDWRLV